jgi:hypothetical protein
MVAIRWVRRSTLLYKMMSAGVKERWEAVPPPNREPSIRARHEFEAFGKFIIGVVIAAFYIAVPLSVIYCLVKFVKWAWEN